MSESQWHTCAASCCEGFPPISLRSPALIASQEHTRPCHSPLSSNNGQAARRSVGSAHPSCEHEEDEGGVLELLEHQPQQPLGLPLPELVGAVDLLPALHGEGALVLQVQPMGVAAAQRLGKPLWEAIAGELLAVLGLQTAQDAQVWS